MIEKDLDTLNKSSSQNIDSIKNMFYTLFKKLPVGAALIDSLTGEIYYANHKFKEKIKIDFDNNRNIDRISYSHRDDFQIEFDNMEKLNKGEIDTFSMEKGFISTSGSVISMNMTVIPVTIEEQKTGLHLCIVEDLTEKDKTIQKITYSLEHDVLTGLYNRNYINKEFYQLKEAKIFPISIILGNVNGLKFFNETYGYLEGDKELIRIGNTIRDFLKDKAKVARFSGDEFIIILAGYKEKEVKDLINELSEHVIDSYKNLDEKALDISFGYGIQKSLDSTIVELYKDAAVSMYNRLYHNNRSIKNNKLKAIFDILFDKKNRELDHSHRVEEISVKISQLINLDEEYVTRVKSQDYLLDVENIEIDSNSIKE